MVASWFLASLLLLDVFSVQICHDWSRQGQLMHQESLLEKSQQPVSRKVKRWTQPAHINGHIRHLEVKGPAPSSFEAQNDNQEVVGATLHKITDLLWNYFINGVGWGVTIYWNYFINNLLFYEGSSTDLCTVAIHGWGKLCGGFFYEGIYHN